MISCQACGRESAADARFCAQCGARLDGAGVPAIAPETRPTVMSDLRGEERLVTVVFADMTESVRRTSGLDAEQATELVNPLLETMVELMLRYGGRIDRFLGDGVLAVFGVPAAHEDDPIRAVRAALELRERAEGLGLAVTSGVNTGRVYFGPVGSDLHQELTVMGPTVNLAARLQGKAAAGEVVVGSATAAHLAAAFELAPLTLEIKGMSEPVSAFRADRLLDHPDKVRGIEGLRADLVGRDTELDRLRTGFAEEATMAVIGPAGVGKSRLAAEFRSLVVSDGGRWLEGRCLELTSSTPYSVVADLFTRHLPRPDPAGVAAALDQVVADETRRREIEPFLVHLIGHRLGDDRDLRVDESDADQRAALTIDAVLTYLSALATVGPVAVFLDDLHWSDPLSRDLIRALQAAKPDALTLLFALRPDLDVAAFADPDDVRTITLGELSESDSRDLIRRLLDISGIPVHLEEAILDRAQGNPFYLEELIRSLIQRGLVARADGRWTVTAEDVEVDLPESVEALLMSRFDRLPNATRAAARVVSVLDRPFRTDLFSALAGDAGELATLTGAGILSSDDGEHGFVHALTRQAIYSNLLPSQRAELHERAAKVLKEAPIVDVDQVAFHYAQSRNHLEAVEWLLRAGERALDAYTTEAARRWLEEGLARVEELPAEDRRWWRCRFQARLGALWLRMARHAEAREAFEVAVADMDPSPLEEARIWRLVGRSLHLDDRFGEAHEAYDRAERLLEQVYETDEPAGRREWIAVQKERGFALYFGGRGRELGAHNERMRPVVERFGTPTQQADHLYGQALSSFIAHRFVVPPEAVDLTRRALAIAEAGAGPGRVAEGRFSLGLALLWSDQFEEAAAALETAVADNVRLGSVMVSCQARAYQAIALRCLGRVDEAEAAASEALEAARALDSGYYVGHATAVSCWVAYRRGDPECERLGEEALKAWGELERDGIEGVNCEFAWLAAWPLAAAAADRGDHTLAADRLRVLLTPWERPMPADLREAVETAVSDPSADATHTAIGLAIHHGML